MNDTQKTAPAQEPQGTSAKSWLVRFGLLIFLALALLLGWLLAITIAPREWADFIGKQSDGSMFRATVYGLVIGFLFTLVPLVIARQALRGFKLGMRLTILALAIVVALPNLLTLAVVLGTNHSAEVARRTLDDDAAGFRVGTVSGAIVAALVFSLLVAWGISRWNDKRKIRKYQELQSELAAKAIDEES